MSKDNQTAKKRTKATEILVANLALPGSGTMMAGQRIHGFLQSATAITGFLMTLYFAVWFIADWARTGVLPTQAITEAGVIPKTWIKPLLIGIGGVVVFVGALGWAFLTSLAIGSRLKQSESESQL